MTIESQKSIWIAAAVLALIFLAGGLAGAAIALFARRPAFPHDVMMERIHLPEVPPAPGAPGGAVFYKRLGDEFGAELGLDEEQAARVDSMMEVQRQKSDSLLESMGPRLKALMDSTNADIEAVLTEESGAGGSGRCRPGATESSSGAAPRRDIRTPHPRRRAAIRRSFILAAAAVAAIPILLVPRRRADRGRRADGGRRGPVRRAPDTPAGRRARECSGSPWRATTPPPGLHRGACAPVPRRACDPDHVRINARCARRVATTPSSAGIEPAPSRSWSARKTGELRLLTLTHRPEPAHRIDGVGVRPLDAGGRNRDAVRPDRAHTTPRSRPRSATTSIASWRRTPFSGAVLVARGGAPIFERAYGEGEQELRRPQRRGHEVQSPGR
jgi:hypothetical protein